MLLWIFTHMSLCGYKFAFLRLRFLGINCCYMVHLFNLLRNSQHIFQNSCTLLHRHQQCTQVIHFSISSLTLSIICLFDYSHSNGYVLISCWDFDLHFPNDQWCCISFCILFKPVIHFLWWNVYSNHLLIFNWVFSLPSNYWLVRVIQLLCIQAIYKIYDLQILSSSLRHGVLFSF